MSLRCVRRLLACGARSRKRTSLAAITNSSTRARVAIAKQHRSLKGKFWGAHAGRSDCADDRDSRQGRDF
eukprot:scaffold246104_cov19-Prasinocladus_malaysianus.AAC.1